VNWAGNPDVVEVAKDDVEIAAQAADPWIPAVFDADTIRRENACSV